MKLASREIVIVIDIQTFDMACQLNIIDHLKFNGEALLNLQEKPQIVRLITIVAMTLF